MFSGTAKRSTHPNIVWYHTAQHQLLVGQYKQASIIGRTDPLKSNIKTSCIGKRLNRRIGQRLSSVEAGGL